MNDNVLAVIVIALGAAVGVTGAFINSKELIALGATVAGYGAAWFQASHKPAQSS